MRIGGLAAEEQASQVDVQHAVPFFQRKFLRRFANIDAGIVDQDIHAPELLDRRIHSRLRTAFFRQIHRDGSGTAAQGFHRAPVLFGITARDHDRGSGSS